MSEFEDWVFLSDYMENANGRNVSLVLLVIQKNLEWKPRW